MSGYGAEKANVIFCSGRSSDFLQHVEMLHTLHAERRVSALGLATLSFEEKDPAGAQERGANSPRD
jgi:hypothetical protein